MDHAIDAAVNGFLLAHPLFAATWREIATWIVPLIAAAAVLPWLVSGRGVDVRKRATSASLFAAALALLVNQLVIALWQRPRPYSTWADITPLAGTSADPSFPSDHAAAAVAIAVAALLVYRRAGLALLGLAVVAVASRVAVGAHYPTDVLAGAAIGAGAAFVVVKAQRVWLPLAVLVARLTDGLRLRLLALPGIRAARHDHRVRTAVLAVVGLAIALRIVAATWGHVLDEAPLALLAGWIAVVAIGVWALRPEGVTATR